MNSRLLPYFGLVPEALIRFRLSHRLGYRVASRLGSRRDIDAGFVHGRVVSPEKRQTLLRTDLKVATHVSASWTAQIPGFAAAGPSAGRRVHQTVRGPVLIQAGLGADVESGQATLQTRGTLHDSRVVAARRAARLEHLALFVVRRIMFGPNNV
jgi:hypothetical protein